MPDAVHESSRVKDGSHPTSPRGTGGDGWWRKGAMAGLIVLLVTLFLPRPLGEFLEQLSFDLVFALAPSAQPSDVVIIEMDEKSHRELGQSYGLWSRRLHAQLVDRLTVDAARLVVFDIVFADPGDPDETAELAAAFRQNGRVIIGVGQSRRIRPGAVVAEADRPIESLASAAAGLGSVGLPVDPDLGVRRIHLDGPMLHGLAWKAALQIDPLLDDDGRSRWMRFYPSPDPIERISYSDALLLPNDSFRDKVVFVGSRPSTPKLGDDIDVFRTPSTRWGDPGSAGVEIQATAFLNLVRQEWLRRPSFQIELGLLLCIGFVWGFGMRMIGPRTALAVGAMGGTLVVVAAIALPWMTRLWIPWAIVVVVQVPVALAWSIASALREWRRDKARSISAGVEIDESSLPISTTDSKPGRSVATAGEGNVAPAIPDHRLLKRIGAGAYGEVWLAENVVGSLHAVKIVRRDKFESVAPYDREFRGIERFMPISRGHPNLVNVLHAGRRDDLGFFFYIMEAADSIERPGAGTGVDGYVARTLARQLKDRGHLPLRESIEIMIALGAAVDYLHRHDLVHRDIKPTNVIFVNRVPKLADIGLVTQIAATGRHVTYLGTQGYIAPEGPGSPCADLFSLGKVLYEMATGLDRLDFPDLPTSILDRLDDPQLCRFNRILLKACDNDAQRRYQTADAFVRDLNALLPQATPDSAL